MDMHNLILESGHFIKGGVFRQVEIELSWFFATPGLDEVANLNQPPGAVGELIGEFFGGG